MGYIKLSKDQLSTLKLDVGFVLEQFKELQEIKAVLELSKAIGRYKEKKAFFILSRKNMSNKKAVKRLIDLISSPMYLGRYGSSTVLHRNFMWPLWDSVETLYLSLKHLDEESYIDIEKYSHIQQMKELIKDFREKNLESTTLTDDFCEVLYLYNIFFKKCYEKEIKYFDKLYEKR